MTKNDDTSLIYCDVCDRTFHLSCVVPQLVKVPEGMFVCGNCIDCRHCEKPFNPNSYSVSPYACLACYNIKKLSTSYNRKCTITYLRSEPVLTSPILLFRNIPASTCSLCCSPCLGEIDGSGYQCSVCHFNVHVECDGRASYFKAGFVDATGLYTCTSCVNSTSARSEDCKSIYDLLREIQKYRGM